MDVPGGRPRDVRRRRLLNILLLAVAASSALMLLILLIVGAFGSVGHQGELRRLLLGSLAGVLGAGVIYGLNRHVSGDLAAAVFLALLMAVASLSDKPQQVVDGRGLFVFAIPILAASVLLKPWASFAAAGASSIVIVAMGLIVVRQPVPNLPAVPSFFILATVSWLSARSLENALDELSISNQRLKESEARYRLHFENVSDVVYSLDRQCRIRDISPSVERLLGYEPEDLMGRPFQELNVVAPESLERALSDAMRVLDGERVSSVLQFVTRDGTRIWGEVSATPLIHDARVTGLVAVARDVTERRRLEQQLRQQERLAAVGQLAGGIAHDFNNILAGITLYAQLPLRTADLAPGTEEALTSILEESHRAADLVQQILDFSRSAMMETEPISLSALVHEAMTLLRRTIPESIHLQAEMGADPCTIQGDPTRIHQALMNLALNARDAMPDGGELRLAVEPLTVATDDEPPLPDMAPGAWARLTVSDTGIGMTEEVQAHLFEPFFTTKEEGRGTGLGLAQVYGIVKQHQGFIDVDTAPDEGTAFSIYLPLVEDEGRGTPAQDSTPPSGGRGETILVVEDADRLRRAIEAGLTSLGYNVVSAANGREAMEILPAQHVDLVLTDVVMPQMGGEALLHALRAEDPHLKVIAMTGHVVDTDVQGLRASGFSAALPKPFSIEKLTRVVRDVLDG